MKRSSLWQPIRHEGAMAQTRTALRCIEEKMWDKLNTDRLSESRKWTMFYHSSCGHTEKQRNFSFKWKVKYWVHKTCYVAPRETTLQTPSSAKNKKTSPPERNSFNSSWVPPPHPHNTTNITARVTSVTGNDNVLWMQQLIHCVFQMKWLHRPLTADWFWPNLKCLPFLLRPISAKNVINNNKS